MVWLTTQYMDHLCDVFRPFLAISLDVNFNHKNDGFWIWVQLIKYVLSSIVSTPIENFEKYINIIQYFIAMW